MKNKFLNFRTIAQLLFVAVAFVLAVAITMGFEFEVEALKDIGFWIEVSIKLAATLIIYNTVFGIDNNARRQIEDSKYYVTMATNRLRVGEIYRGKLFEELDKAIAAENKEKYEQECNQMLRKVSRRVSYADVDWEAPDTDGIAAKLLLSARATKKLRKAITKIANGIVEYPAVEPDDILLDKDGIKDLPSSIVFDVKKFILKQNAIKALMFLLSTIAVTIVSFSVAKMDLWQAVLTNSALLLGAIVSGISFSYNYIRTRASVFEQRNRFLERRMGLTVEYVAPTNPKPNK